MQDLVSVIIPAYNTEAYIAAAIRSVERQTYTAWELIVVNDGSTDKTMEAVRPFLDNPKIRVIEQENVGVAAARNAGIENSRGSYVSFLDSDDFWSENFLEEMLRTLTSCGEERCFVYSGYDYLQPDGSYTRKRISYVEGRIGNYMKIKGFVLPMTVAAILVPRRVMDAYGVRFFAGCTLGEDREFLAKLLSVASAKALPKELFHYRYRRGSCTRNGWQLSKVTARLEAHVRAAAFIKERYDGENRLGVAHKCDEIVLYQKYRYLWEVMKRGHYELVRRKVDEWRADLWLALKLPIYWNNKLQCGLLLSKQIWLWKLCKKR